MDENKFSIEAFSSQESWVSDFCLKTHTQKVGQSYDFLVFLDSRGTRINKESDNHKSFFYSLLDQLKRMGYSFIAMTRPYELTTFSSLIFFKVLINKIIVPVKGNIKFW